MRARSRFNLHRRGAVLVTAAVASSLITTIAVSPVASAAGGPSVPLPDTKSVAVTQETMQARGQDDASKAELRGDQAASTPPGGGGTATATSLSPSATWNVSAQTGDFSWSYPLRVPP